MSKIPGVSRSLFGGKPKVAVSLRAAVSPRALAAMRRAGVDLVEFRADLFRSRDPRRALAELSRFRGLPVLVTVRAAHEGGAWKGSDAERIALYAALLPHAAAADVELSSPEVLAAVARLARRYKKPLVVSFHDFKRTPSAAALRSVLRRAKRAGAAVVKIAAHASKPSDVRTLGAFTAAHPRENLITISMGKEGAVSRVLFPALGSRVTFSCYGTPTAPGQFNYEATLAMLRNMGQRD